MAIVENASRPEAVAAWKARLHTMSREGMLAQQICQRGAVHALEHLIVAGPTMENARAMLASLHDGLAAIEEAGRMRGMGLMDYEAPDEAARAQGEGV